MAYKFQIGAAKLSGSIIQTSGSSITALSNFKIGSVTVDQTELGILDGATVSTAELNILDGVTATTSELNILDGVTADANELNLLVGSEAGSVANSKAVIYGA